MKKIVVDANIILSAILGKRTIRPFPPSYYNKYEAQAKRRIAARDEDDWPLVALALTLDCPIWTEDNDFFGTGIATWHTGNVEIYLNNQ